MQFLIPVCLISLTLLLTSTSASAQSFMPSPQQIEQFKNLPRAQQEQLARQMGFDVSMLNSASGNKQSSAANDSAEFVEREVDNKRISSELARQSVAERETRTLKPFGFDLFKNRQEASVPISNMPVPPNYVLGPGDTVKLQLFGKETGSFELRVNNEGNVDLPDLGPMQVAGASFQELKQLMNEKYNQQKIGVTPFISMGQLRTIQVFLVGEVFRPGPLVVNSLSTITTALTNSGGIGDIGSMRNIQLKRGGNTVATFDLYQLMVFGDTANDLRLEQGDVIFVPTAENIVSIDGEVRRPAIYELKQGETIDSLLRLAGGLLPTADASSLQLVRATPQDGLTIASIDGNKTSELRKALKNGDYLRIPEATREFSNAIKVKGALNVPSVIADDGNITLASIITSNTLLANTDLEYGIIARRAPLDQKTKVIQFTPREVLAGESNIALQAFDEVLIFNRISDNTARGVEGAVSSGDLESAEDDIKGGVEARFAQQQESKRFTTDILSSASLVSASRKTLLAPLISRLKSEASDRHPVRLAEVRGQVKYPGVYPLAQNSSIQAMLSAAGGLTESAHLESAEITRLVLVDGKSDTQHKKIAIMNELLLPKAQQVQLGSKDVLSILRIPNWYENDVIELRGEVVFPGTYQISRGETLSSIIARAGGLTEKASPRAAIFTREELKQKERNNIDRSVEDLREQLANNNLSNSQFSRSIDYENANRVLNDLTNIEPVGRMVIQLADIVNGSQKADIEVKGGDRLFIPNVTPAISVIGEVFVNTTYRFDDTLSVEDYIERAGGAREFADTSSIYIVRADGSVETIQSDYWFSATKGNVLEPGDTIVVPRDVTNYDNISLWQGVTQIIYQTAVALAAVRSF